MAKKIASGVGTLCIDIGGTGLKLMVVDEKGTAKTERLRVETPQPAKPAAVLGALKTLIAQVKVPYGRVSVGFPGVVIGGVTKSAPNLHESWTGFDLDRAVEKLSGHAARCLNDAGVQGYGVIEGRGTELCITLGTGFGFALYVDGHYVPNIEMAHHPAAKGKTYEELLGNRALEKAGKKKWNQRVAKLLDQLERTFNYRVLYIGGGNAKKLDQKLPRNVKVVENVAGLLGGVKLWDDAPTKR